MGKRSKRLKLKKKQIRKASKFNTKKVVLRTYKEMLEELIAKGIKPYDSVFYDFEEYDSGPLKKIFEDFYKYAQEYLDRKDLGFDIEPARIYYSSDTSLNALARRVKEYYLIEIFVGSIKWMHDFCMSKEDKFKDQSLAPFLRITQIKNVSPAFFLLQLMTIYFLYHEVGHLIQRSGEDADYVEFAAYQCTGDEVRIRHMRELDADWHSAYCLALAIKQFAEIKRKGKNIVDEGLLSDIASLGLAAMYMYFIDGTDRNPKLYYEEKCHPHPAIRLAYMVTFILDNLQGNVSHKLNKKLILQNAIIISEILMKEDGKNVVKDYSEQLSENINEVEAYIHKIMENAESYKYLCKHILKLSK